MFAAIIMIHTVSILFINIPRIADTVRSFLIYIKGILSFSY